MQLANIRIHNFRCFADAELNLSSGTVLIGANNSGKSTAVEALRLLFSRTDRFGQPFTYANSASAYFLRRRPTPGLIWSGEPRPPGEPVVIRAEFDGLSDAQRQVWSPMLGEGRLAVGAVLRDGDLAPSYCGVLSDAAIESFTSTARAKRGSEPYLADELPAAVQGWVDWMTENLDPIRFDGEWWVEWAALEEFIHQDAWPDPHPPPGSTMKVPSPHSLAYIPGPEVPMVDVMDVLRPILQAQAVTMFGEALLTDEVGDDLDFLSAPLLPYMTAAREAAKRIGHSYSRALPRYLREFQSAQLTVPPVQDAWKELFRHLLGDSTLRLTSKSGREVAMEEMGAGARRAAAISALEVFRDPDAWDPSDWTLLIVEEPEVGLHPGAQRHVAKALRSLPTHGVQTVVVSHSPIFVNELSREAIQVARQAADENRDPVHVIVQPAGLREVSAELGILPADALLASAFLVVEGLSDANALRLWARATAVDLDQLGVRIAVAGGHGMSTVTSRLAELAYEGARFWAILDGGPETAPTKLKLERQLGSKVRVVVLSKPEIEGFYAHAAVSRWLASEGAKHSESEIHRLVKGPLSKNALRRISRDLLGRDYNTVRDGERIVGDMPEAEIPPEIRGILSDIAQDLN